MMAQGVLIFTKNGKFFGVNINAISVKAVLSEMDVIKDDYINNGYVFYGSYISHLH